MQLSDRPGAVQRPYRRLDTAAAAPPCGLRLCESAVLPTWPLLYQVRHRNDSRLQSDGMHVVSAMCTRTMPGHDYAERMAAAACCLSCTAAAISSSYASHSVMHRSGAPHRAYRVCTCYLSRQGGRYSLCRRHARARAPRSLVRRALSRRSCTCSVCRRGRARRGPPDMAARSPPELPPAMQRSVCAAAPRKMGHPPAWNRQRPHAQQEMQGQCMAGSHASCRDLKPAVHNLRGLCAYHAQVHSSGAPYGMAG